MARVQQLQREKEELLRENQRLQNQPTERDKETETQIAIAEQLRSEKEELRRRNQELQDENATLRKQLNGQRPPSLPPGQIHPAPLQKIYRNINPEVKSNALAKNNQGYFDFNKGKYEDAIEYFENAIKSDPEAAIIYYNLGSTYLKMKEYTKAVNYLQKAVKLDSEFKEAHYNLALALGKGTVR